jgi:hypothetical protein
MLTAMVWLFFLLNACRYLQRLTGARRRRNRYGSVMMSHSYA